MNNLFQSADWKKEKHVPVIEAPDAVGKGEPFTVSVSVGREIAHPNTTAHHICWIDLYFLPEGAKLPVQLGRADFAAHGASPRGADTGPVHTAPAAVFTLSTELPGVLYAASYCNIHGLWESSLEITLA